MTEISDNKFLKIEFSKEKSLMVHTWKAATYSMHDSEYQDIAHTQLASILKYCPKNWLIDTNEFKFILVPELQSWADQLMGKLNDAGINKIAFINSIDFFSQVSVEQLMNEPKSQQLNVLLNYFKTKNEALAWLLS